ncbi:MAG: glycosyltransferase [Candidatus Methanoperedens sp.]|nr:glycosyltransferase [Candidatus Methanoperedens sp.]
MKIIFIPDYKHTNAYQRNLADSLSKQDAEVCFGTFFGLFAVFRSVWKFWKPDIIHIHWTYPYIFGDNKIITIIKSSEFIFELFLLKLSGISVIWTVHNIINHEGKFKNVELFFNKILARLCNNVIVHCSFAKKEVMKVYGINGSNITVIPHGNYIGSYENVISYSQARERLKLNMKDIVFLNFGQIRPYKGINELITSFETLNNPNVRLLIVGKPLNNKVAQDILDRCQNNTHIKTFFGFIPDNEVQVYMNAADIVILPYKDILTSGAVIIAMSFGRPIIATLTGCLADTLDEKGSFLYLKTEGGLLETMQRVLNTDKAKLQSMGAHNLRLAEGLGWDEIAKKTCNVYMKCSK